MIIPISLISIIFIRKVHSFAFAAHPSMLQAQKSENLESSQGVEDSGQTIRKLMPPDSTDESMPTLKFGEKLSFEDLGPIIINTDGTTRRIANWDTMTEKEREVSWRRIKKRNEERIKLLEAEQQQLSSSDGDSDQKEKDSAQSPE